MDAQKELARYKAIVDRKLKAYFKAKQEEARKQDPLAERALKIVEKLTLSGGKRVRAAMMYWGYRAAGGRELQKIIDVSLSIELIHIFLLIHDDIIDRDDKRHGVETLHKYYEAVSKKIARHSDHAHFGNSIALVVGDMVATMGNHVIFNSKFQSEHVMRALTKLQDVVSVTVFGQMRDVWLELTNSATEKDILAVHEHKTAKYTIEGPLHLGAILGGADGELLDDLSAYSIPIGIAFQIQDDILGVYGDERRLGKPVGSDLKQGKQTLLIVKALEKGTPEDKKFIRTKLGSNNLTSGEIDKFREIIQRTRSLDYSRRLALELIEKGKAVISRSRHIKDNQARQFFLGIADYLIARDI